MLNNFEERQLLRNTTYFFIVVAFAFFGSYIYIDNKVNILSYPQNFSVPNVNILTEDQIASERLKMLPAVRKPANITEDKEVNSVQILSQSEIDTVTKTSLPTTMATNSNLDYVPIQTPDILVKYADGKTETLPATENNIPKTYLSANASVEVVSKDNSTDTSYFTGNGAVYAIESDRIVISKSDGSGYFFIDKTGKFEVLINGNKITLNNLQVGDKISIDGQIIKSSSVAKSGTITVTGYPQLFAL
ncbi:MAG: hypothetical protein R3B60_03450 [Candidatus Paceibacterota bacterium]